MNDQTIDNATIKIELPLLGVISLELPTSAAKDDRLIKELVLLNYERIFGCFSFFLGLILAGGVSCAIHAYLWHDLAKPLSAELREEVSEMKAEFEKKQERVDLLLSSFVTSDSRALVEEAKSQFSNELRLEAEKLYQESLIELKERLRIEGRHKHYPEGVQVVFIRNSYDKSDVENVNEFLKSQIEVIDIMYFDYKWVIVYLSKDKKSQ